MSITAAHFFHRRNFLREGGDTASLPYRAPLFPLLPIAAFILCVISLIGIGFDPTQATALYFGIPFVAACYAYFHFKHGRGKKAPKDQEDSQPQKISAP
jgi:S-methylmethionine transporter